MSLPLGEESTSTEPVDWGVSGAWVEAGESSDISGAEDVAEKDDPIGQMARRHGGVGEADKQQTNECQAEDGGKGRGLNEGIKDVPSGGHDQIGSQGNRLSKLLGNPKQNKRFDFTCWIAGMRQTTGARDEGECEGGCQL